MRAQLGPVGHAIAELPSDDPSLEGVGDVRLSLGRVVAALIGWHGLLLAVFLLGVWLGSGG